MPNFLLKQKSNVNLSNKPLKKPKIGGLKVSKKMAEKFILSSGIDIKFFKKYIRLVEGDVKYTTKSRPKGKIALLFTEMDLYQPTKDALENLFGKMSKGGIVCPLYSESNKISFPGNIKAIKDFFGKKILKFKTHTPTMKKYYIV